MRNLSRPTSLSVLLFAGAAVLLAATPPDFSGKWTMDPSQSQDTNGETIQLTIQEPAGKMAYDRVLREKNGKEQHISFTCASLGAPCDLEENGHKAKVLWYDGSALMMAKTGGEGKDATTERKFTLSPDGKTLTVVFTNYSGSGKPQKLIFTKQ